MFNKIKNKKAAIGATMTWVVATIIILFVIIVFVYAAKLLADKKDFKFSSGQNLVVQSGVVEQNLLGLMQTDINGKTLLQILVDGEQKEKSNEIVNLLRKIPNCFRHNRGGSWVFAHYSIEGKLFGKIGDITPSGRNLADSKFNFVIYSDTEFIQLNEVCVIPGIGYI